MVNKKIISLLLLILMLIPIASAITLRTVSIDGRNFDSTGQYNFLPATINVNGVTLANSIQPYVSEFTSVPEKQLIVISSTASGYQTNKDWQYFDSVSNACRTTNCEYTSNGYTLSCNYLATKDWVNCKVTNPDQDTAFSYDYRVYDNKYQYISKLYNLNGKPELYLVNQFFNEDTTPASNFINLYSYTFDFESLDNELTYAITSQSNPSLTSCSITSNQYIDCSTPALNQNGFNDLSIRITDNKGASVTDTLRVVVSPINDAPTLNFIGNQIGNENQVLTFTISGNDIENSALTYSAQGLPTGANFVGNTFNWTPSYAQAGSFNITFKVTDAQGLEDIETITITINEVCQEVWVKDTNTCQNNDFKLISYTDTNTCGTTNDLPADSGSNESCDFCAPSWTPGSYGTCQVDDSQTRSYSDSNSCYATTNLISDLLGVPTDDTQTCDFCTPTWSETIGACQIDNTQIGIFSDSSSCFLATGLAADNNKPADNTYACDYCSPSWTLSTTWSACQLGDIQTKDYFDSNSCYDTTNNDTDLLGQPADLTQTCDFCTPSWSPEVNSCLPNDKILVSYTDSNSCGENDLLPANNGTYDDCDFCAPNWTLNTTWGACQPEELQYRTYFDQDSCYETTKLPSDLIGEPAQQSQICSYDNDGDTFTELAGDCNDNDNTIFPGATELIDNIDQNCVNDAPRLNVIGNKITSENQLLTFSVSGYDFEADALTYNAYDLPLGATFVANTFSWTPSFEQTGTYNINITVSDGNLIDYEYITITVNNINRAPVLDLINNITVNELDKITITPTATDADGNSLTYSYSSPLNSLGEWTTTYNDAGTYTTTITVTDGLLSDSQDVTITVNNVNRVPVLNAIGAKSVNENQLITITPTATDADGQTLTYSATGLPTGATFVTDTFSWTPTFTQEGTYDITFEVSDGVDTTNEIITITVNNVNRVPSLNTIGNKIINENQLLTFAISGSDLDLQTLTYSATNLPTGATFVGTTYSWTPTFTQAGTYDITFEVSDGVDTRNENVTIMVNNVNRAPVLDFINNVVINENNLVQLIPSATDVDGDSLTYSFTSPINSSGEWQTTYSDSGVYTTTVIVSDGSLTDSQSVGIIVNNVNRAPVLDFINNVVINEGGLLQLMPTATDADGNSLTYSFTSPLNSSGEWQTSYSDSGVYTTTITVSDGSLIDNQNVTITVNNVNSAPVVQTLSNYTIDHSGTIYFKINATDTDNQTLTYSTDSPIGTLNQATGEFNYNANYTDIGVHNLTFYVSDAENVVTITNQVIVTERDALENKGLSYIISQLPNDAIIEYNVSMYYTELGQFKWDLKATWNHTGKTVIAYIEYNSNTNKLDILDQVLVDRYANNYYPFVYTIESDIKANIENKTISIVNNANSEV